MNGFLAVRVGAIWMALAVGIGAFGAHGLKARLLLMDSMETWQTAVRYQAWHALGLILLGVLTVGAKGEASRGRASGWLLLVGSGLFSSSLYLLATHPSEKWVGPITPIGGLCMILGWIGFASKVARPGPTDADLSS